jgi:hypothetical protein
MSHAPQQPAGSSSVDDDRFRRFSQYLRLLDYYGITTVKLETTPVDSCWLGKNGRRPYSWSLLQSEGAITDTRGRSNIASVAPEGGGTWRQ